jgi:hypothetical protein
MKKKFAFISLISILALVFSMPAFAGEGSDTIGACRLMPELRYSYYETPMVTDNWSFFDLLKEPVDVDWRAKEHSAVVGLTWGAMDNLDLYTFVGARICSELEATNDDFPTGTTTTGDFRAEFDLDTGFTCGLGVRGTFFRADNGFYVGGGASVTYALTHGHKDYEEYVDGTLIYDAIDNGFYYQEQNLAAVADLHAGWNFKNIGLTPYVGAEYRWNKAYVKEKYDFAYTPDHYDITFREQKPVGVYVGLDYRIGNRLNLNLEGHMINRWGGSFAVGYLFDICGKPEPYVPAPAPAPPIEPKLEPMSFK